MATKGYNSYHGRTPLWKKILIPILVLLLLAGGAFLYCQNQDRKGTRLNSSHVT